MLTAGVLNEKIFTWFVRAYGTIINIEHRDDSADPDDAFSELECSKCENRTAEKTSGKLEGDRQSIASTPKEVQQLALSQRKMLSHSSSDTCKATKIEQKKRRPSIDNCEREVSIPGLLPNSILDQWTRPLIFARDRVRARALRSSTQHPRFRLVIDPPKGEQLATWTALKKTANAEVDIDLDLLKPPSRESRKERKIRRQEMRENILARTKRPERKMSDAVL